MEYIDPDAVYDSTAPLSRAVVHDDIVYLSGVLGLEPETGEYGETMADQTRLAFENVKATLEEAGSSLDQLIRLEIYFSDPDLKSEMNEVYREYITEPYPARAAIENEFSGDRMVEIVATAAR